MGRSSSKREEIYAFLKDYIASHGYPPTTREIMAGVGLRSTASVHYHLSELNRSGAIEMDGGKNRAISLGAEAAPQGVRPVSYTHLPRRLPGGRLRRLRAERRAGRGIRPAHHARRQARGLWPHRAYPHGLARPLHPALSGREALRRLRLLAPALSGGVPHQGAARDGRPEPHRRAEPAARRPDARAGVDVYKRQR